MFSILSCSHLLQAPCVFQFWSWGKRVFSCFILSSLFPNLESQTVVTLAPATVKTSLIVVALVEVVTVSVVEAVGVTVVVAASPTIIVIPTKEDPAHLCQEKKVFDAFPEGEGGYRNLD